jgi:hypothetical protein
MLSRRHFLSSAALLPLLPLTRLRAAENAQATRYLSACSDRQGKHFLAGLNARGELSFQTPLPGRAHAVTPHPNENYCMVVARRPGDFLLAVDSQSGKVLAKAAPTRHRHFYGHGVFEPSGQLFYASENAFDAGKGVIGVYDAADGWRRIGELASHGIGPHELLMTPDGDTLAVANGGIRTHPDTGRAKLNLASMAPSLAYIDRHSGALLEKASLAPALRRLSIRHLDLIDERRIAIAMQYQGGAADKVPLAALHVRGQPLRALELPESVRIRLRQYGGSVKADDSGQWLAASAPRGNRVCFWHLQKGFIDAIEVADGCGLAASAEPGEFIISSGDGEVLRYRCPARQLQRLDSHAGRRWDNHLSQV